MSPDCIFSLILILNLRLQDLYWSNFILVFSGCDQGLLLLGLDPDLLQLLLSVRWHHLLFNLVSLSELRLRLGRDVVALRETRVLLVLVRILTLDHCNFSRALVFRLLSRNFADCIGSLAHSLSLLILSHC